MKKVIGVRNVAKKGGMLLTGFSLFWLFGFSCGTGNEQPAETDGGTDEVGSIISNPGFNDPQTLVLFPVFESFIPTSMLIPPPSENSSPPPAPGEVADPDSIPAPVAHSNWNELTGTFLRQVVLVTDNLVGFNNELAEKTEITLTETPQTITLDESLSLLGTEALWEITAQMEGVSERYFFTNPHADSATDTGSPALSATYVIAERDSDANPIKGNFAWTHVSDSSLGPHVIGLVFDFSNPDQYLMLSRIEKFHKILGYDITYHLFFSCNSSQECVAEFQIISETPPTRLITRGFLTSWNSDWLICMARTSYDGGVRKIIDTYQWTGPSLPMTGDIQGTCTPRTTPWDEPTPEEFYVRKGDDPFNYTWKVYRGDGVSTTSWSTSILPEQIDTWPLGQGLAP